MKPRSGEMYLQRLLETHQQPGETVLKVLGQTALWQPELVGRAGLQYGLGGKLHDQL